MGCLGFHCTRLKQQVTVAKGEMDSAEIKHLVPTLALPSNRNNNID